MEMTDVRVDETALRVEIAKNGYKNLTEFVDASGVPRGTVDNLLSGRNVPNQRTIQLIYDALPVSDMQHKFSIFFRQDLHDTQAMQNTKGETNDGKAEEA